MQHVSSLVSVSENALKCTIFLSGNRFTIYCQRVTKQHSIALQQHDTFALILFICNDLYFNSVRRLNIIIHDCQKTQNSSSILTTAVWKLYSWRTNQKRKYIFFPCSPTIVWKANKDAFIPLCISISITFVGSWLFQQIRTQICKESQSWMERNIQS